MNDLVMVFVKTNDLNESIFNPKIKKNFTIHKNVELNEVLRIVSRKYPNFVSFYWKNLLISKAI